MYSCARGQHLCVAGRPRKRVQISGGSCSLCTSNAASVVGAGAATGPRTRGSKANETASANAPMNIDTEGGGWGWGGRPASPPASTAVNERRRGRELCVWRGGGVPTLSEG